jgi:hypothetical protein
MLKENNNFGFSIAGGFFFIQFLSCVFFLTFFFVVHSFCCCCCWMLRQHYTQRDILINEGLLLFNTGVIEFNYDLKIQ